MAIWIAITALAACVTAVLLAAVFRRTERPAAGMAADQAVFRDQLLELERDVAAGHVPKSEAQAIRAEVARRILAAERNLPKLQSSAPRLTSVLMAASVPVFAVAVYLKLGAPNVPDTPLSARLESAAKNEDMSAMVRVVELQLQANPDDARAWGVIAPVYSRTGRHDDAATAYQNLMRLGEVSAENYASLAEALTMANGGIVTTPAMTAAAEAIKLDPSHVKARFYDAAGAKQEGRNEDALKKYRALLDDSPPDASWRGIVEQEIASLSGAPALTEAQMASGNAMPEGERKEMIASMVDGLEQRLKTDGKDLQGWLRLIRARTVMGEAEKAKAALLSAKSTLGASPDAVAALDALAKELNIR